MTLALLLTAVTGAWAQEETLLTTITPTAKEQASYSTANVATVSFSYLPDCYSVYSDSWGWWGYGFTATVTAAEGYTITKCVFYDNDGASATDSSDPFIVETEEQDKKPKVNGATFGAFTSAGIKMIEVYGYVTPAATTEPDVEVTPGSSANTWTFSMPGSDVVLTPIYAKAAAFATTGTEPDVKTLLPEAAEGVIAGTDASLIAEGTGIVAFAGTSTEVTQGTLMYAIGTSATEAPALTDFSATAPTAENVADDGADVYVWYYIQGADTPQGEAATLDNTFNDTEPACLTVTVLTNKFDIQFNAANANTIEAGKATVTVGGTAATVTEGKLEGVKMGTEVKMTAKEGYKFRKVEVKKKALPALNITNPVVGQVIGSDGKNYAYGSLPTGVTAVAKICYVSGSNGLALALTDEGTMDWSTAMTTCAAHTPAFTGGTWKLASEDEWNSMISTAGSFDDLRDGFSSVGGTNMESGYYWSSTESGANGARDYNFVSGDWGGGGKGLSDCVRACLAF